MYATHLHLMLTHFSIVGTIIGMGILIYGLFKNNDDIKKVALTIFIITGIIVVPIYFTGEWSKLIVEKLPEISSNFVKSHEDIAIQSIFLTGILILFSIFALIAINKKLKFVKIIIILTLLVSLITFGFFIKTANLGGQIRHTEIVEQPLN